MSEEMAVSDNGTGDEVLMQTDEHPAEPEVEAEAVTLEQPSEAVMEPSESQSTNTDDTPGLETPQETPQDPETKDTPKEPPKASTPQLETHLDIIKMEHGESLTEEKIFDTDIIHGDSFNIKTEDIKTEDIKDVKLENLEDDERGIKRRASAAFDDDNNDIEFLGFEEIKQDDVSEEYSQILERLEAEVSAASQSFTPVRYVMATPLAHLRPTKRPRKDTDGSRPSSAQSSRSEDDNPSASPAHRGRRATTEISSPLLRIPLERGWKRELVYRAALDAYSRRNADIYYYTPLGKKLRSTREVAENLSGTGLTLENFSFFKEPLGLDDPEKEIIRDAKVMRRVESPITSPAAAVVDGKRAPKPKPPKGASPEPATPKSPPAKIKVKSMGARLSGSTPAPKEKQKKAPATPTAPTTAAPVTPTADNNNTATWKKPRAPEPAAGPPLDDAPDFGAAWRSEPDTRAPIPETWAPNPDMRAPIPETWAPIPDARASQAQNKEVPKPAEVRKPQVLVKSKQIAPKAVTPPPQPAQEMSSPDLQSPRRVLQPCSLSCGSGVPSLSCVACFCLYHPACAGFVPGTSTDNFHCKNCRRPSPPPAAPANKPASERRLTLRMKMSPGGARVWAVAGAPAPAALPQSLALVRGKRFIVVPRPAPLPAAAAPHSHDMGRRVANGAGVAVAAVAGTPRRRGRPKADDTDHFSAFYNKAHTDDKSNLAIQIFQYLGMRDLAHCARVSKLWRQLAATPSLWRHVRMKNSHVSDWGGLCAALKRHGTKWLDLRKMLLPQNDTVFWEQFAHHIGTVDTLERLELCRCPASAVEAAARSLPGLRSLSALAIRDAALDPAPLGAPLQLRELRLKSLAGLALTADLTALASLRHLQHLSLTSIKELGWRACDVIGSLGNLESLELGECTFRAEFAGVLARLGRLRRLRLERGTAHCAAPAILRALARLPHLTRLELVNVDVKVGFDDALAECKNIQRLLIIPTYVSQSATTNKQVLSGVLRLKETLTHLMWGVTIELLRVTELFIDQCSAGGGARRELGECIPVLKPVPGCRLPMDHQLVAGPPQVEIVPLPTLQRLLSSQLPNTKLKLLRIPFHATWRQSLADFQ